MTATVILTMPAALRKTLSKMIALLGSPEHGDVVNAASAIDRTLRAEGLDLNAFAEFIACGQQLETSDLTRILTAELRGRVREVLAGAWALSESERKFVREYEQRLDRDLKTTCWDDFVQLEMLCRHVRR
ncbi:MAG: hypothetical protein PSV22_03580, partial [Pseudolabrys sp.]|nr:hypothetical protein [Pseudolabrys sp.]